VTNSPLLQLGVAGEAPLGLSSIEQVKEPTASVNPLNQALSKLGFIPSQRGPLVDISCLYNLLYANNHNLNCSFLLSRQRLPLSIEIIFNSPSLLLTLKQ
jgi:hypothetical protein